MDHSNNQLDTVNTILIDVAVESWRFARLFGRMLTKLDAGENARYANQYRYFLKRLEESIEGAGMHLVNVEGQLYDPGMAIKTLNIEDFKPEDRLLVDQMIEPIIMGKEGVIRSGSVMLRKAEL